MCVHLSWFDLCVCAFSFHLMRTNDYIMHLPPRIANHSLTGGLIRKADFKFWKSLLYTLRLHFVWFAEQHVVESMVQQKSSASAIYRVRRFERSRERPERERERKWQCLIYFDICRLSHNDDIRSSSSRSRDGSGGDNSSNSRMSILYRWLIALPLHSLHLLHSHF